ncbi:uncharacterized protein LOC144420803 [Styela clava]
MELGKCSIFVGVSMVCIFCHQASEAFLIDSVKSAVSDVVGKTTKYLEDHPELVKAGMTAAMFAGDEEGRRLQTLDDQKDEDSQQYFDEAIENEIIPEISDVSVSTEDKRA